MTRALRTDRTRPKRAPDTRPTAARRGYGRRWQRARKAFLSRNPLCAECGGAAEVVDHHIPHRGCMTAFWDQSNWQSLCKHCHDVKTARHDGAFGRVRTKNHCNLSSVDRGRSVDFPRKGFY